MRIGDVGGQPDEQTIRSCSAPELVALADAVAHLSIPTDGPVLAQLFALADRLAARISEEVDRFDHATLWDFDGATSLTAWLRTNAGLSGRDASSLTRTTRRLRTCPITRAGWVDGTLTGGQVQAITTNIEDRTADLFATHEPDLIPTLTGLSVADTATAMRTWAAHADAVTNNPEPTDDQHRSLHLSTTLNGRGCLDGDLDPEATALIDHALRHALGDHHDPADTRTPATQRADALVAVCEHFLGHNHHGQPRRRRPHLSAIITLDDLTAGQPGQLDSGTILSGPTLRKLACDANLNRVVTNGASTILDYGRTQRTVPRNLFNALTIRDRHCRYPGCDRPTDWCEAHHIQHWANGGPTNLNNLVLLCLRHHHVIHQPGWHLRLDPDTTTITVTNPAGHPQQSNPPLLR